MLLIGNGNVVCPDKVIENGAVYAEGKLITEIGPAADLKKKYPQACFVDAKGGVIMPGLINTHMHFYSTFARGMYLKNFAPANFVEILEGLWWRLDKKLTNDDTYYSALIPLIECIKCGTTTIIDHHASPFAVDGSLDLIAKAVKETGLRASLCYEVSDRDGDEIAKAGIAENVRFIRKCSSSLKGNGEISVPSPLWGEGQGERERITGMMGLHASFTVSDRTMEHAVAEARGLGVGCHIHTAEAISDLEDAKKKYGMGVVERLHSRGVLGKQTITAHCIHISEKEMDLLAETETNAVHNPESNMNNAVGCAQVIKMFQKGVLVGLGTDGMTSDMFRESKVANIIHKHENNDPKVGFMEAFNMLVKNNAEIASKLFPAPSPLSAKGGSASGGGETCLPAGRGPEVRGREGENKKLGVIAKGAYADIIVLDYQPPTPLTIDNFAGHLLFGLSAGDVATTVCNGRVLMEDRKLIGINESEITAKSRELAKRLWVRI